MHRKMMLTKPASDWIWWALNLKSSRVQNLFFRFTVHASFCWLLFFFFQIYCILYSLFFWASHFPCRFFGLGTALGRGPKARNLPPSKTWGKSRTRRRVCQKAFWCFWRMLRLHYIFAKMQIQFGFKKMIIFYKLNISEIKYPDSTYLKIYL